MSRLVEHLQREGSTRALGLMRLGTGLLLWARFGREMMPLRELAPDRVLLSLAFYLFSTAMVVGVATPVTVPLMAVVMGVMVIGYGGYGTVDDWGHHHTTMHMLAVWWLALTPSGRSFSVDRWWALRQAEKRGQPAPEEKGPQWAVVLLGLQVCTLYLWSLVDKLDNGFYTGVQLEQLGMQYYFGADPPDGLGPLYKALAWSVLLLELVLPFGLWVRRLQPVMFALGITMHLAFYVLIPVQTFTLQMILLYLAFLDPEAAHRSIDRLLGYPTPKGGGA